MTFFYYKLLLNHHLNVCVIFHGVRTNENNLWWNKIIRLEVMLTCYFAGGRGGDKT